MYKLLICDDNKAVVSKIKFVISDKYSGQFDITEITNVCDERANAAYDIILMDIDLDNVDKNGIDLASELMKKNPGAQVIFISSYHEYAQEIFEIRPVYYVQKPIDNKVLIRAVDRALSNIKESESKSFSFQKSGELITLDVTDIVYFESKLRRIKIVTTSNEYEYYERLDEVENLLREIGSEFIRCHQSFLVNPRHITTVATTDVLTDCNVSLPISKARYQSTRMEYMKYITRG